jgi:hypothetical protein
MISRHARLFAALAVVMVGALSACSSSNVEGNPTGGSGGTAGPGSGGADPGSGSGGQSGSGGAVGSGTGGAGTGGAVTTGSGGATDGGSASDVPVNASDGSTADGIGLPPLPPCTAPAVSHLKVWEMQVVGGTMTPNGSPLRKVGEDYEMYVAWTLQGSGGYGTANAPLNNQGEYSSGADPKKNAVDISTGPGVVLEYATTGPTYMQIRTSTEPHGGNHYRADLPLTGGQIKIATLNFADFRLPGGKTPPGTDILKDAFSFTFVAGGTTNLTLRQVRVAGFTPPCN